MAKIDEILRAAVTRKASDIHFSAESPVMMRRHGDLEPLEPKVYSNQELQEMLFEIISESDKKKFTDHKNLDKSYSVPNCGNFRLNFFWTRRGVGAVIRWLPTRMPEIDDLGLPPIVKKLADLPKGLLLVTGPTGSGKSTTLASIINYMNTNFSYHILTVEDPVEFVHPCKKSLINQREIGQSCLTFADALKYALREDPDVILVGEMRDQETIGLALTAAETGHLVLGTLHTRGAASSIDRIIESFPATERPLVRAMLSESLRAVISQILLKGPEGNGRVAAYEIMVSNYAISNLIREGKTFQIPSILQTAKGEGMMQMEAHIRQLMAEGKVDPVEADAALSSMVRANQNPGSGPGGGGAAGGPTGMVKPSVMTGDAAKRDMKPGAKGPSSIRQPIIQPGKQPAAQKPVEKAPAQPPAQPPASPAVASSEATKQSPRVEPEKIVVKTAEKPVEKVTLERPRPVEKPVEKPVERPRMPEAPVAKVGVKPAAAPGPLPITEKTGERVLAMDKTVAGITVKNLQAEAKAVEEKAAADPSLRSLNEVTLPPVTKTSATHSGAPKFPVDLKPPAAPKPAVAPTMAAPVAVAVPAAPKPVVTNAPAMPKVPVAPVAPKPTPKANPSPVVVPTAAEEITKAPSEGSLKRAPQAARPVPGPAKKAG